MGVVLHTCTYYNTTGASVENRVDIIDREASEGTTLNFAIKNPTLRYAGLPQDLKPGIYPTTFSFEMAIRQHEQTVNGITYQVNNTFIDDIAAANEGKYSVEYYRDDVLQFRGPLVTDQCQWGDEYNPFLKIEAADGSYRWGSEDYVSEVGQIRYKTLKREHQDGITQFSSDPVTVDQSGEELEGTEWIMIEHLSQITYTNSGIQSFPSSYRETTYARYEQYIVESPGDGWVDQGGSLWAKQLTYSNQVVVDEDQLYHLTRDIDDTPFRTISEFISRGMAVIPGAEDYGVNPLYDVCCAWYEDGMPDETSDPLQWIRVSEESVASGKKWKQVFEEIAKHFYLRIYYSVGRFHFEQISERGETEISRHVYDYEGTFIETEDAELDKSYSVLGLKTTTNGSYRFIAPLKNVLVTQAIADPNLLLDIDWVADSRFIANQVGQRYVGRIKKDTDMRLLLNLSCNFAGQFDLETWGQLSESLQELSTPSRQYVHFTVRIRNIQTDTTYHLQPDEQNNASENASTWEAVATEAYFDKYALLPPVAGEYRTQYKQFNYKTLSEELPGSVGDTFDIYVAVNFRAHFLWSSFAAYWTETNPTKYLHRRWTENNSLLTVNADEEPINGDANRAYEVVNHPDNSLSIEIPAKFGDLGGKGEFIEIYTGSAWIRSSNWRRGGTGDYVEFLQLLAQEIMSLRTVPRRLYQGGFATSILSTENRIVRDSLYWLPLNVSLDTDVDHFSGEFIAIARVAPPGGETTVLPWMPPPAPPNLGEDEDIIQPPLYFVTDELIEATSTSTQMAIVNTLGVVIPAGETVSILNVATGETESLVLTADIEAGDVLMEYEENIFTYSYPVGSPIFLQDGHVSTDGGGSVYEYSNRLYNGLTHTVPLTVDLSLLEGMSVFQLNKKVKITRNGIDMLPFDYVTFNVHGSNYFWIDFDDNQLIWEFEFVDEAIVIKIDLNA